MSSQRARIAARAFELWERRGKPQGSPEIDWAAAEKEILGTDDPTQPKATGDSIEAGDVLLTDSDRGPIATGTETTPPDGPIPKRARRSRESARQTRGNGAGE